MRNLKVYIVNTSPHDFSPAEKYGELVFLNEGYTQKFEVSTVYREYLEKLEDSRQEDYLLCTGLTQLNIVAALILAVKHGKINFLMFQHRRGAPSTYVTRTLSIKDLLDEYAQHNPNHNNDGRREETIAEE